MRGYLRAAVWVLLVVAALVFAVWLGLRLADAGYRCVVIAKVLVCHRD